MQKKLLLTLFMVLSSSASAQKKDAAADRPLPPFSHLLGSAALIGVGAWAWLGHWEPLTLGLAVLAVLVLTAIWEWGSFHGGWRRWTPWLGRMVGADPAAAQEK